MPDSASPQFTGIWQAENPIEQDWVDEIFGPFISSFVTDGRHELALDHSILFDAFTAANDPAYYAKFRGKNAFLVHFLDETYEGGFEIYDNFQGVLRCFWSDAFNPQRVRALPLGYMSGIERNRANLIPASQRKYVWSFLGQLGKSSRPDMAHALVHVVPNFIFATDTLPGFLVHNKLQDGSRRLFPRDEFSEFLFDSSFSPSPMGNANIECFRVYEALECGSIPIVESRMSLDYYRELLGPHPMPTVRSWAQAQKLLHHYLNNPAEMDQLQHACITWWKQYKVSYIAQLGDFLSTRSEPAFSPQALGPVMMPKYHQRAWQQRELLRHHDLRAFTRRIQKQAQRLLKTGGTREAFRPGHPDA